MSWRAQALLWPGVCALLYVAWIVLQFGAFEDVVVLSLIVPIAAVGCAFVFGGFAIATALFVRAVFRSVLAGSGLLVQRCFLATATGLVLFTFWMVLWASSVEITSELWLYGTGVGVIAAIASAIYARPLFDEQVENREPGGI